VEATERLGRCRIKVHLARAHLLYGEWLRRENRRIDARESLRTAYELFSTMGAEAFAERAARELLATGETARKRTADTRGQLTAHESTYENPYGVRRMAWHRLSARRPEAGGVSNRASSRCLLAGSPSFRSR
jgi:hypothetical protein